MPIQFEITDSDGVAVDDISDVTFAKKVTQRLGLPWTCSGRTAGAAAAAIVKGARVKARIGGGIVFNGIIQSREVDGDENTITVEWTAADPMIMWPRRIARDGAAGDQGNFSKPTFFTRGLTAPEIMEEIIEQSQDGSDDALGEGTLGISIGTVGGAGVPIYSGIVNYPMRISDVYAYLNDTGQLDAVLVPSDTTDGIMSTLDLYDGDVGTDLTGSVSFDYWTGSLNVARMRLFEDLSTITNKLWYYLGPKKSWTGPGERYRANITADDPGLADPPQTALDALIAASRSAYLVQMDVKIFDDIDAEADDSLRELYRYLWQREVLYRVNGRTLIYVLPHKGIEPGGFGIGDLVEVNAGAAFAGGFSGAAVRIYGQSFEEDDKTGVTYISELVTSADQG